MKPDQLKYDPETALRYSDPPDLLTLKQGTLHLVDYYHALLKLRDAAKAQHIELIHRGVFQSIPTLTSEKRNGRPGTYWRAVFKTNSPEVMGGQPRKHYIGNSQPHLQEWKDWITRTQLAIDLNLLIHDLGMDLKRTALTIRQQTHHTEAYCASYKLELEQLQ